MSEELVKLIVAGVTYSQVQNGAYALLLAEDEGEMRIPVVIGLSEAQSIAVCLENVVTSRPLPHDLMVSTMKAFGISLDEVLIYDFKDGVFLSELHLSDDERKITIDSRTSDAVALALRTKVPIYTTKRILEETGFRSSRKVVRIVNGKVEPEKRDLPLERLSVESLEKLIKISVEKENYERAAEIKKIIEQKTQTEVNETKNINNKEKNEEY